MPVHYSQTLQQQSFFKYTNKTNKTSFLSKSNLQHI
jgi:hypothetical protein